MFSKSLPRISFVIPTYNESKNIEPCLKSIYKQNYPKNLIEVIVVDDYSTDDTLKKASKFPVKILFNGFHDGEVGKMIGFKSAKGDFFYYLDADIELRGRNWIKKMIYPLVNDPGIIGVFTRKYAKKQATSLERFFAMEPLHRDIVFELFSPSIESTISIDMGGYKTCIFKKNKIPPAGRCLYRIKELSKYIKGKPRFMELDFLVLLVSNGRKRFAYVEDAGIFHHHVRNLKELILKRKRNVQKVYLPRLGKRLYKWFNIKNPKDMLKIIFLIFYSYTFVFSLSRGVYKSIKFKDSAGMWEPAVSFTVTSIIIFAFFTNPKGLNLIFQNFIQGRK